MGLIELKDIRKTYFMGDIKLQEHSHEHSRVP